MKTRTNLPISPGLCPYGDGAAQGPNTLDLWSYELSRKVRTGAPLGGKTLRPSRGFFEAAKRSLSALVFAAMVWFCVAVWA